MARDLSVSSPDAGLLKSSYALGVVIGAPLLAILTAKLPRRPHGWAPGAARDPFPYQIRFLPPQLLATQVEQ